MDPGSRLRRARDDISAKGGVAGTASGQYASASAGGGRHDMSNDKRDGPGGRRRRPATIDLKATEIASEPVQSTEPTDNTKESQPTEASPEVATAPPAPEPGASAATAEGTPAPEPDAGAAPAEGAPTSEL